MSTRSDPRIDVKRRWRPLTRRASMPSHLGCPFLRAATGTLALPSIRAIDGNSLRDLLRGVRGPGTRRKLRLDASDNHMVLHKVLSQSTLWRGAALEVLPFCPLDILQDASSDTLRRMRCRFKQRRAPQCSQAVWPLQDSLLRAGLPGAALERGRPRQNLQEDKKSWRLRAVSCR